MCFDGEHELFTLCRTSSLAVNPGETVSLSASRAWARSALCSSILMLHAHNARYPSGRTSCADTMCWRCSEGARAREENWLRWY